LSEIGSRLGRQSAELTQVDLNSALNIVRRYNFEIKDPTLLPPADGDLYAAITLVQRYGYDVVESQHSANGQPKLGAKVIESEE
jgi:hypothetical protein